MFFSKRVFFSFAENTRRRHSCGFYLRIDPFFFLFESALFFAGFRPPRPDSARDYRAQCIGYDIVTITIYRTLPPKSGVHCEGTICIYKYIYMKGERLLNGRDSVGDAGVDGRLRGKPQKGCVGRRPKRLGTNPGDGHFN